MSYAAKHGYVVFTNDLDFGVILAETNAKRPSVVQVRVGNLRVEAIGDLIINVLHHERDSLEGGCFVSIDPKRTQVRVLPLRRKD